MSLPHLKPWRVPLAINLVQESILRKKDPPLAVMRTALTSNHRRNVLFERPSNPSFDLASSLAADLP